MKKTLLFLMTIITALNSFSQTVSTFAGSGSTGSADGMGTAASFNRPTGIAVDAAGNIYIGDSSGNKIRKITPEGQVSTLAGSGTAGSTNGTGTAASFDYPQGVAVDAGGNVYVADTENNKIRKITPAGVVSNFAGSGTASALDGPANSATFYKPYDVAVDANGNVYVADFNNHKIRKITSAGVVSTLAGSGTAGYTDDTGTAARFTSPRGVTVDADGNVYVTDSSNRIRKITPAGAVSTLAGNGLMGSDNGMGAAARFNFPHGITIGADGNLYVADFSNHKIRMITPAGMVSTFAGSGTPGSDDGIATEASFYAPTGVAVNNSGIVYVADFFNRKVRKIIPGTLPVTLIDFTAKADGNHAKLQWKTANEVNHKGFEIWRKVEGGKAEGLGFVKIGEIQATQYAVRNTQYSFTDKSPLNGNNYYKLIQVDNDGKTTDLGVRQVTFRLQPSTLNLFPNPTTDKLNITFGADQYQNLKLLDITGNVLQKHTLTNTQTEIVLNVSSYPSGSYIVELRGRNSKHFAKILK